jgi:hypothetical protein
VTCRSWRREEADFAIAHFPPPIGGYQASQRFFSSLLLRSSRRHCARNGMETKNYRRHSRGHRVPLALVFAWLVSLVYKPAFEVSLIVGYWLTNVIGLVLLHKGAEKMLKDQDAPGSARRRLIKDLVVSLLYTALIVLLLKLGVLKPFENYFK